MKILVVDDEFTSRKTIEIFCKKLGYEVMAAVNGQEAYDIWLAERPSLVVTDWNMPKMNGLELCSRIKVEQDDDYTYIILVTSRDNMNDLVVAMDSGADDYIVKPFNKDELSVRIRAGERVINFQSKDLLIFALAKLADCRDETTGQHLTRVTHYSKILAQTLHQSPQSPKELDSTLIKHIYQTCSLHDIGKVAIPDHILLKPGKLTEAEFEVMKTHSRKGFDTLNEAVQKAPDARYLKVAAEIALHHHEFYNGNGYPDGLKGEEVPLTCRIFSLADVYDALVSKRPYKKGYSHEKACEIILDAEGSHFDPLICAAFRNCEQKFLKIRDNYRDT
jgi:cyclic di-GMP phosphodiesterase